MSNEPEPPSMGAALIGEVCAAALDALSAGLVLLSPQGRVLHVNPAAEAIVRRADGLSIVQGRLGAPDRAQAQALARLVGRACGRSGPPECGALQLVRPSGKRPLQLVAVPLRVRERERPAMADAPSAAVSALCFISGHEHQTQDAYTVLPQIFGLTPAETRLAVNLLDGGSLREFAERQAISVNTARTQLTSLFAKTGTHRQGELVTVLRAACGHLRLTGPWVEPVAGVAVGVADQPAWMRRSPA